MWVGIGVGIGRNRFATGIFNDYALRVNADGGITEAGQCVDAVSSLLQSASLLLIPSGYKGGKLYAEIPTNGNGDLTWTRGGDAFRTNASGVLQRVPWNLLQYSEDFTNVLWAKTSGGTGSLPVVTSNYASAPNGTITAERIQFNKGTGTTQNDLSIISQLGLTLTTSGTMSVYLKSNTASNQNVLVYWAGGQGQTFVVTPDWQRFSFSNLPPASSGVVIGTRGGTGNYFNGGDNTLDILVWGAQLVEGTTAQTYLPTTDRLNFPRLSYMYGSCPSALLEPQRTNLFLSSQQFTSASWLVGGGGSAVFTDNFAISPDGTTNAARWTAAGTNYQTRQNVATINTTATLSVWMRSNSGTKSVTLFINDTTVTSTISVTTTWQRFSVTGAVGVTLVGAGRCGFSNNSILTNTDYIEVFGAQYEVGAYPTTYIPTTSATATRVADSFSRSNIYTNGLISASGGTWFVELRNNISYVRDAVQSNSIIIDTATGGLTNGFAFIGTSSGRLRLQKYISSTGTVLYTTTTDTVKIAIKWNGSTADIFENGTKVVSATSFTPTAMEFLNATTLDVPKFIQQMALFNSPLSDAQCQTLTTL